MGNEAAWAGLGRAIEGAGDAYQRAKAAAMAQKRQAAMDEAAASESSPIYDAPRGINLPEGVKMNRSEAVAAGTKLADIDAMSRARAAAKKETLKKLPTTGINAQDLANFPTDLKSLKGLGTSIENNKGVLGPWAGPANKLASMVLPEVLQPASVGKFKQVQSDIDNVKQVIGKIKEGGVLRAEDEKKYERILASIKDDPASAQYKIGQIANEMASKYNATIDLLGEQGYETAGLNKQQASKTPHQTLAEQILNDPAAEADDIAWAKAQMGQ